jgi:hypothetical protein
LKVASLGSRRQLLQRRRRLARRRESRVAPEGRARLWRVQPACHCKEEEWAIRHSRLCQRPSSAALGARRGAAMGKNSGHKAMQAQRYSSGGAGGDTAAEAGAPPPSTTHQARRARARPVPWFSGAPPPPQDADVTYHTPEWHAARIAALTVRPVRARPRRPFCWPRGPPSVRPASSRRRRRRRRP